MIDRSDIIAALRKMSVTEGDLDSVTVRKFFPRWKRFATMGIWVSDPKIWAETPAMVDWLVAEFERAFEELDHMGPEKDDDSYHWLPRELQEQSIA